MLSFVLSISCSQILVSSTHLTLDFHGEVKGARQKTGILNVVLNGMNVNVAQLPAVNGESSPVDDCNSPSDNSITPSAQPSARNNRPNRPPAPKPPATGRTPPASTSAPTPKPTATGRAPAVSTSAPALNTTAQSPSPSSSNAAMSPSAAQGAYAVVLYCSQSHCLSICL